ncbi:unnamed protein product, partial [Adineta ricciae]
TINWFRLLPNIKSLFVGLCELRHWITNDSHNQYLNTFLQRLDKIFIECSSITNEYLNEEMMIPFLSFILNRQRFSQLEYLDFFQFQHVSSAWCIINKWTNYILNHCNEHQLKYLQFSLIENDQLLTNMKTGDEIITISDPPRIIDIHRSVSNNYISFWMESRSAPGNGAAANSDDDADIGEIVDEHEFGRNEDSAPLRITSELQLHKFNSLQGTVCSSFQLNLTNG